MTDGEGRRRGVGGGGGGLVPEGTGALVGEAQEVALPSAAGVLQVFVAVIAVVLPHRHLDLPKPMGFCSFTYSFRVPALKAASPHLMSGSVRSFKRDGPPYYLHFGGKKSIYESDKHNGTEEEEVAGKK